MSCGSRSVNLPVRTFSDSSSLVIVGGRSTLSCSLLAAISNACDGNCRLRLMVAFSFPWALSESLKSRMARCVAAMARMLAKGFRSRAM